MRFDAYAATVPDAEYGQVVSVLETGLGGRVVSAKSRGRLDAIVNVEVMNRNACSIGVDRYSGSIFVEGKGETSPALSRLLRVHFPAHTVPRADVCEDYTGSGVFEQLQALIKRVKDPRVYSGYVALSDRQEDGRTWQCGRPMSSVMSRLYEKGKQPGFEHLDPDTVRLEFQVRPQYSSDKVAAARMAPVGFLGYAGWAKRVGEAVLNVDIPRAEVASRSYSLDATMVHVLRAYRRRFEEVFEDGLDLRGMAADLWAEDDRIAEQRKSRKAVQ